MIEVKFKLLSFQDDGFHVLVNVVVFGKKFKAVVDTGASRTVLDKSTVEKYISADKLLITDQLSTGLGTTSMESYTLNVDEIGIGDLIIPDMNVAVLDLSMINSAFEQASIKPVIGVIGGDILVKYKAIINYPLKKITFSKIKRSKLKQIKASLSNVLNGK